MFVVGETAQQLRTFAALPEDWSSIPNTMSGSSEQPVRHPRGAEDRRNNLPREEHVSWSSNAVSVREEKP